MKMAELWRRKRRLALRPKGSVGEQMRKKKEEEEKEEEKVEVEVEPPAQLHP